MKKTKIVFFLFAAILAIRAQAQTSFDTKEGCLNVIDFSYGQGIGKYGDRCISANYMHEKFINEQFCIGGGIGYSHHEKYEFSAIPVYLSAHYFFLDRRFSPYINLCLGGFGMMGKKNVDTNLKYSISKKQPNFNLFVSPSIGVKAHITPNIGVLASLCDDAYFINAFDTSRNEYRGKLIHSLGLNIGVCFQIQGW